MNAFETGSALGPSDALLIVALVCLLSFTLALQLSEQPYAFLETSMQWLAQALLRAGNWVSTLELPVP